MHRRLWVVKCWDARRTWPTGIIPASFAENDNCPRSRPWLTSSLATHGRSGIRPRIGRDSCWARLDSVVGSQNSHRQEFLGSDRKRASGSAFGHRGLVVQVRDVGMGSERGGRRSRATNPIPVLVEDVRIPLEFRRIQAAGFVGWKPGDSRPELDDLFSSLAALIWSCPSHSPRGRSRVLQRGFNRGILSNRRSLHPRFHLFHLEQPPRFGASVLSVEPPNRDPGIRGDASRRRRQNAR